MQKGGRNPTEVSTWFRLDFESGFQETPWSAIFMYSSFRLDFFPPFYRRTYILDFLPSDFQAISIFYISDYQRSFMYTLITVYRHFASRLVNALIVSTCYIVIYLLFIYKFDKLPLLILSLLWDKLMQDWWKVRKKKVSCTIFKDTPLLIWFRDMSLKRVQ